MMKYSWIVCIALSYTLKGYSVEALPILSVPEFENLIEEDQTQVDLSEDQSEWLAAAGKGSLTAAKTNSALQKQIQAALKKGRALASSGQFEEASRHFFSLTRSPYFKDRHVEMKYSLGLMLFEMKLYQLASFILYDVVQTEAKSSSPSKYLRLALEKLNLATNYLESDVLLKSAIGRVNPEDFPAAQRDMFYYRMGNIKLAENEFDEASRVFARIPRDSGFFALSKYRQGLALTESGQLDRALQAFKELEEVSSKKVTDVNRVNAILGQARVYYQKKDFEKAVDLYREIPRDTTQWHDSLFERSWAMLRIAKFRSALSNFHTLHSTYYKDFYLPETLLMRSIVYLYICRWDEMEKTLDLFDRVYKPMHKSVFDIISQDQTDEFYFTEIKKVSQAVKEKAEKNPDTRIPYVLLRQVLKEGDIQKNLKYLTRLEQEQSIINRLSGKWQKSTIGVYAKKRMMRRMANTKSEVSRLVQKHLRFLRSDLRRLIEEADFLKLELVTGQKEAVRKTIAGKGIQENVAQQSGREFFVQNGYEYWPFQGEYWLDELGNYHYVGVQNCQK